MGGPSIIFNKYNDANKIHIRGFYIQKYEKDWL